MGWAGNVASRGVMTNAYEILFVKPEGKRPPGRRRRRWEDDIGIDLREIAWKGIS
jgi:hypothetical protein